MLALALALAGCGPLRAEPAGADTSVISAMNAATLSSLSPDAQEQQFALMAQQGVTLVRDDATWSVVEPKAPGAKGHDYDWPGIDTGVTELAQQGLTWLPILDYSATWAASTPGDWRSPPADDATFAAYGQALAARYGDGGTFWQQNPQLPYRPVQMFEVWNEENTDYFWDTGPDPGAYAKLYLAARAAIHAVEPTAQVIVGGVNWPQQGIDAISFVQQMFAADPSLRGNVDAFGLHPYAASPSGMQQHVVDFRNALDALGEGSAPIDITEFGWDYQGIVDEPGRALEYTNVATGLARSNCGIGLLAPYDWYDPSPSDGQDWGLADDNGLRPAGTSWFAGLSTATNLPTEQLCPVVTTPPTVSSVPPAATIPTAAQIRVQLAGGLRPTGKHARIATLLRAGFAPAKVRALVAGRVTIAWYLVPKGAHLARAAHGRAKRPKPELVARGSARFAAAGTKTVEVRLTKLGRRLLRGARPLGITAQGSFTPSGGAAVSATKRFTLR